MTPAQYVAIAESWIGVPYHHQGRNRLGVDCVGLIEVCVAAGDAIPEGYRNPTNYGRRPGAELQAGLERWCTRLDAARDGCLVQIQWPHEELASHLGIYAGGDLIHAYKQAGRVVRQAYRGSWVRLTVGFWTAPGVAYE